MASCWTSRYEALGYDGPTAAILGLIHTDTLDHCLTEEARYDWLDEVCLLADGHDGDHEYTPTAGIVVTFAASAPPQEEA